MNISAMDNRTLATFQNLIAGKIYSRAELIQMLYQNGLSGNIAGISVNRWNKGMTNSHFNSILFEFISRGKYKYLGLNHTYTGPTYWYGHSNNPIGLIGHWNNGAFVFAVNGINNFDEWIMGGFKYI